MTFKEKLLKAAANNNSWLCVGLDPEPSQLPPHLGTGPEAILAFNRAVIEATRGSVCAYKPNAAFYEAMGAKGWEVLVETVRSVPKEIPVILDFKRGDIGNTAKMYARAAFEAVGADAVTLSPYLGRDSVEPFLEYGDKGLFVLCLTSNPSAAELQKKIILLDNPPTAEGMSPQSKAKTFAEFFNISTVELYLYMARLAAEWNEKAGNVGLVVGATSPVELERVRQEIGGDMPILIPGVGAQGGDLEKSLLAGSNANGELAIINVARAILYAGKGEDYAAAVHDAAENYQNRIAESLEKKRPVRG